MLRVERRVFEKAVIQIVTSTDLRDLIREFSPYRIFFYSLLKDISSGEDSPNYPILKKIARDRKINERFIIDQAKFVLSQFAPDELEEDYYEILNISSTASSEEIRKSWLKLMKTYHPDNVGDRGLDITKRLNEAYSVLGDPVKRGKYDARRLPALPIVISSPLVKIPSRKFVYPFSLAVVTCILALYVVKSGYFYPPVEKNRLAKVEKKEPTKEVNPVKGDKSEKAGSSLIQTSSSKPDMKESFSSEPKAEKMRMALLSTEEQEGIFIGHAVAGIERTPEKEDKKPLQLQRRESPKDKPKGGGYVVKYGDNLWEIAGRFKISVKELKDVNNLKGNRISTGQTLIIPQAGHTYAKEETEVAKQYGFASDKEEDPKLTDKGPQEKLQTKSVKSAEPKKSESVYAQEETVSAPHPDRTSLYSFVSQYVSAYKDRDITTFMSLFEPNARENGVEISKSLESYMDNFSSLEIIKYDVKIRGVNLKNDRAFTFADFDLTFRKKSEGETKSTNGKIVWVLSWRNNHWRIKEINYKINDVESWGG